jgi:phage/plasmid primase-like uncharacterized protein
MRAASWPIDRLPPDARVFEMNELTPLSPEEIPDASILAPDDAERIAKARTIVASCRAITGTFGDAYLTSRGIDISALPKGIARYHEESRALVFPARDEDGIIKACQRLFFGADGAPVMIEKNGNKKKKRLSKGLLKGAALSVPGDGDVLICEGAEDGLSLSFATRQPVRIAFGVSNLGTVPLPDGEPVIIVADNDKAGIEGAHAAAAMLVERGHAAKIVVPPDGVKDANELLIKQGAEAVRSMVAAAAPFEPMPDDTPEDGSAADDDIDAEIKRFARLKPIELSAVASSRK